MKLKGFIFASGFLGLVIYTYSQNLYFLSTASAREHLLLWRGIPLPIRFQATDNSSADSAVTVQQSIRPNEDVTLARNLESVSTLLKTLNVGLKSQKKGLLVADDQLFFATSDDGWLYAIDRTGQLIWKFNTTKGFTGLVTDKDYVYAATGTGRVFKIAKGDGRLSWAIDIGDSISESPVLMDGEILLASYDYARRSYVLKVNKSSGEMSWRSEPVFGKTLGPPLINTQLDTAAVATQDGWLYGFKLSTGSKVWSFQSTAPLKHAPLSSNDLIWLSDSANLELLAIAFADGQIAMRVPIPQQAQRVGHNQSQIFFNKASNQLHVFSLENRLFSRPFISLKGGSFDEVLIASQIFNNNSQILLSCGLALCRFNLKSGQLINRYPLAGRPLALSNGGKNTVIVTTNWPGSIYRLRFK